MSCMVLECWVSLRVILGVAEMHKIYADQLKLQYFHWGKIAFKDSSFYSGFPWQDDYVRRNSVISTNTSLE